MSKIKIDTYTLKSFRFTVSMFFVKNKNHLKSFLLTSLITICFMTLLIKS